MTSSLRYSLLGCLVAALVGCTSTEEPASQPPGTVEEEEDDGKADAVTEAKKSDFFASGTFWFFRIRGWDSKHMTPETLAEAFETPGAELAIYKANPASDKHCPDSEVSDADMIYKGSDFSVRTSGNFTNGKPKSSYKIKFGSKKTRLFGMRAMNLKSMWNDVSQMRESIAWDQFRQARVPSSRHTYARFCMNDHYYGLYSVVEQVDESFLGTWFGDNNAGNLYKAYWSDIGPSDLSYRKGADGDDSGRQYFTASDIEQRSYRLQTNEEPEDDPKLQTYDDLATFIRVINGVGLEGETPAKFDTAEYRSSVEHVFDARGFLRWAGVNTLLGAWDNYYRTPANYYLYNSGPKREPKAFMDAPYFTWIPWDYDNSLGVDALGIAWQEGDIVDWRKTSQGPKIPLLQNLLSNSEFRAYYLDHLEHVLSTSFREDLILGNIGEEGSDGLWDRVRQSAYLEADGPAVAPHTGRLFTNDQVYWNGFHHDELWWGGNMHAYGIKHFVVMRTSSVNKQLTKWRQTHPKGSSGVTFPDARTPLPE